MKTFKDYLEEAYSRYSYTPYRRQRDCDEGHFSKHDELKHELEHEDAGYTSRKAWVKAGKPKPKTPA